MKIRFATRVDLPALVEVGRRIHAETRFKQFVFRADRVAENPAAVIGNTRGVHCFLVAGSIERHLFSDQFVATLIDLVVLPGKRMSGAGVRLMAAFRQWAVNRGAGELNAGVSSGVALERMDRFFRRLGFQCIGGN